jgi:hypothetical protein
MSATNVSNALKNNDFYKNTEQFWKMIHHICLLQPELNKLEYRQLLRQLFLAIETITNYQTIHYNADSIYHCYFLILDNLRSFNSVVNWMANEEPDALKHLHHIYRLLHSVAKSDMPGFGQSLSPTCPCSFPPPM